MSGAPRLHVDTAPRRREEYAARRRWGGVEAEATMKTDVTTERRRGRRVDARLQIELQLEPGGPSHPSSTINISSNGVYFSSPRFVAPLTKLGLRLLLPGDESGAEQ